MTKTEINLFTGAAASLAVAGIITFYKPVTVWAVLALFALYKSVLS